MKIIEINGLTLVVIGLDEEAELKPCTICKQEKELRPYGPNGAFVCFECAMKDEPNAHAMFERQLRGGS